jgi:hypothetical protein
LQFSEQKVEIKAAIALLSERVDILSGVSPVKAMASLLQDVRISVGAIQACGFRAEIVEPDQWAPR